MAEIALPPSDEPFDFRRQAGTYGRYRRDYSPALYDTIETHAGAAGGRSALDLGCGTGFVTATLGRRGWRATGIDFSAPMLAEARRAGLPIVRARAEALPVRSATAALVTSGTAFHWFPPAPTLAEVARVLVPGGWVALFWRYVAPDEATVAVVRDVARALGHWTPEGTLHVHAPEPFLGTSLVALPPVVLETTLEFTAASYHGYVATVEWLRRLTGDDHPVFLARLRDALAQRFPTPFQERNHEYLFLARRPAAG